MSRFISVVAAGLLLATAVPTFAAEPRGAATTAVQAADDLAVKVKSALDADAELKNQKITVTAEKGTVTLEGEAQSVVARAKAGEIAVKTEGVKKVNNKLKLAKTQAGS